MIPSLLFLAAVIGPSESWLVGAWAPASSACGSPREISFEANGTYSESSSEGSWSLAGNQLTVDAGEDEPGRWEIVQLKARSVAEMELQWPDGTRANYRRCPL